MHGAIACQGCDLLVNVEHLSDRQKAYCPRCGHFLTDRREDAIDRVLAYAVAAVVALMIACSFPFLSFASSGLESVMTLLQAPRALWSNGMHVVAILVAAFIIAIPAAVLVLLLLLCLPLSRRRSRPWLVPVARLLFELQSWAMVEVFIIGVIVSLVKIAKMAHVELGLAFWAYVAFALLFTLAMAVLDRYQLWEAIETLEDGKRG